MANNELITEDQVAAAVRAFVNAGKSGADMMGAIRRAVEEAYAVAAPAQGGLSDALPERLPGQLAKDVPWRDVQPDTFCYILKHETVFDGDEVLRCWNAMRAALESSGQQGNLSDAEIVRIGHESGRRYNTLNLVTEQGLCEFARAIESRIRGQQCGVSDAARYCEWRAAMCREDEKFMDNLVNALPSRLDIPDGSTATADEWDAAIDAAIQAQAKDKK